MEAPKSYWFDCNRSSNWGLRNCSLSHLKERSTVSGTEICRLKRRGNHQRFGGAHFNFTRPAIRIRGLPITLRYPLRYSTIDYFYEFTRFPRVCDRRRSTASC